MKRQTDLRVLTLLLVSAVALLGSSILNHNSLAQEQQRKFEVGEMVEVGGGQWVKILRCRGAGDNEECDVQYYRGDTPESTPRWENADFLRRAEERIRDYKKRQAAQPETENRDRAKPQPAPQAEPKETETTEKTDCSFIAPPADNSKTAKASAELFKRKIYDRHNVFANGTISAPLKVGVTFLSFQVSKPFINIVRVDRVVGAYRINDAAPVNATIYPVKSEHIVCEQYRDRTTRTRVENKYACFKNRDGEWVCGADGIPKTTQLN
jgi:hypothetical protein